MYPIPHLEEWFSQVAKEDKALADRARGMVHIRTYIEADFTVEVEGLVGRFPDIGGFERYRFIAAGIWYFDAAVPILVLYITPAEENEAGFELLDVCEEWL